MANLPRVIRNVEEMISWRKTLAPAKQVGFVPTMGALHEGHATLLKEVKSRCDVSVLSVFVNPTQFGPKEDFGNYPRTFEKDLEIAAREGIDIVFAPDPSDIYPAGFSTYVEEIDLSQTLCGRFRPGHFRGVTTVVLKLFNIVRPKIALFGLKDAQQFLVLQKMVRDLHMDVLVEGIPTVRERDELAMSSRNAYLSIEERAKAPFLFQTLKWLETKLGSSSLDSLLSEARARLVDHGFQLQYLECLELPNLTPVTLDPANSKSASVSQQFPELLIAVAAYLGKTRLIDNVIVRRSQ